MPGSRTINASYCPLKHSDGSLVKDGGGYEMPSVTFATNSIPTPLLHVCNIARDLAKKAYKIGFKEENMPWKPTYVDWERDTLRVDHSTLISLVRPWRIITLVMPDEFGMRWNGSLRHLEYDCSFDNAGWYRGNLTRFEFFWKLKTLTILKLGANSRRREYLTTQIRRALHDVWRKHLRNGDKMPEVIIE